MYTSKSLSNFELVDQPNDHLFQLERNDRLAIAISKELSLSPIRKGNNRMDPKLKIYCFGNSNSLHEYELTLLLRKNFPYLNEMNKFLKYASGVGLIEKWLKNYRSIAEKPPSYDYEMFKAESLYIAFTVFLCMMFASFIVVIMEKFVHKTVRTGNGGRFWRYIEIIIDPYRYLLLNDLAY